MSRTVPSPPTEVPGNFQTSALFNAQVRDLNNFDLARPVFYGYQGTLQAIGTTATAITIDTETIDSDVGHSNTTNPSRYTATVPGLYLVMGYATFVSNATGVRSAQIALNGTVIRGSQTTLNASATTQCSYPTWALAQMNGTTDYVEVRASQTAGGTVNSYIGTDIAPSLIVYWLSR